MDERETSQNYLIKAIAISQDTVSRFLYILRKANLNSYFKQRWF